MYNFNVLTAETEYTENHLENKINNLQSFFTSVFNPKKPLTTNKHPLLEKIGLKKLRAMKKGEVIKLTKIEKTTIEVQKID